MTVQNSSSGLASYGVRLSPQQRNLWTLRQNGYTAIARGLVRLDGKLDLERLARALEGVVARHEILRTTFRKDTRLKFPLQLVVQDKASVWKSVDVVDLSTEEQQRTAVEALWRDASQIRFDLEQGPLLHAVLVRCSEQRHELVVTLPALCADAWTLRLLVREIAEAYAGDSVRASHAEELVQYAQFAEWQNGLTGEDDKTRARALAPLVLPFEGTAGEAGFDYAVAETDIDAARVHGLESLARDQGASLAAVLLAAWQVHLGRFGEGREFVLAVGFDGRAFEEVQEVMGPVAKWVSVPCRTENALEFSELVRQVQSTLEEVALEDPRFELDRSEGGVRFDPVGFEFEELPEPRSISGLSWQLVSRCAGVSGFKLALSAVRRRDGVVRLSFWYDGRRMPTDGVAALVEQYATLLDSAIAGWAAPVGQLNLLSTKERERHLAEGRGVKHDSGEQMCLHQSFERRAESQPGALAVLCGEQRLTYREVDRRANQLAHHLRRHGVQRGQPVGLCCERSGDMIVGLLGILKAGGAYVPLDSHTPVQRLGHQIHHAGLSLLVTNDRAGLRQPGVDCALISLDHASLLDQEPVTKPVVSVLPDDLASVIFTSGSTGVPKGVGVTHRGIAGYTRSLCEALGIEPGLHFATVSTLSADLGNTSIFASLASGGCLHVIEYETATDGRLFSEYCRRRPLDVLKIVPSHLSALLDTSEGAAVLPRRLLVLGGEALPLALVERIAERSSRCAVVNHYGPTETTVGVLVMPLSELVERRGCASVPIGLPLASAEAYILDERLSPCASGTVGELYLGGAGLARGYLGQPDLTAERFVPHPFAKGSRLYRTGDRARYRPDGTIEFMGRRDHQLKIRGFRVELGEIEARVREHPAVGQAVVTVRDDGTRGRSVVAYVVLRDRTFDPAALRGFLKDQLPEYMIPSDFVTLNALPLTANGKVDRQALPSPTERRAKCKHVAPRTRVEEAIAKIWADVLGIAQVSVEDNFFELGGNSLLAIPLVHRIQQALGGSISLMAIFQEPTVAGLARLLGTERPASGSIPFRASGSRPPLFCVDPTGRHVAMYEPLANAMPEDQPVFGLELGPAFAGEGESAGAGASIRRITERLAHEVRQRQLHGPYHLLGWSLGGVLALGMARVLEVQGESVAFLGILDTQPRMRLYAEGQPDPVEELAGYIDPNRRAELLAFAPAEVQALREKLRGLGPAERVIEAVAWAQARGFLPNEAQPDVFLHRYALLRDAALFVNELPPRGLETPIHAWWSTETLTRHGGPPVDWQQYTRADVHTETVIGDHMTAVQSGEVHVRVRAILDGLNPKASRA